MAVLAGILAVLAAYYIVELLKGTPNYKSKGDDQLYLQIQNLVKELETSDEILSMTNHDKSTSAPF